MSDFLLSGKNGGCPGVPVHGGFPIVFISIHGVVMQFVNVSFLCVPVHEDTTEKWHLEIFRLPWINIIVTCADVMKRI